MLLQELLPGVERLFHPALAFQGRYGKTYHVPPDWHREIFLYTLIDGRAARGLLTHHCPTVAKIGRRRSCNGLPSAADAGAPFRAGRPQAFVDTTNLSGHTIRIPCDDSVVCFRFAGRPAASFKLAPPRLLFDGTLRPKRPHIDSIL